MKETVTETNSAPRVSVVLCTFQGAHYLQEQLDSLASQTLPPFELIACDDGSTDRTLSILEDFRRSAIFPVRISRNPVNLGSSKNFDQAMGLAKGEYLALCDQDDRWEPDKLAILTEALRANPLAGGVFSDAALIDGEGRIAMGGKTLWQVNGFSRSKQRQFAEGGAAGLLLRSDLVTGATMMIRSEALRGVQPIPASWVHDGWITWRLILVSSLIFVPKPLVEYRIHPQQQLGAGGGSRRQRLQAMRATERARYARVADQFEDLLRSFDLSLQGSAVAEDLRRKIDFLRRRSQLPHAMYMRLIFMMRESKNYKSYARGWRSMRKDLFLS